MAKRKTFLKRQNRSLAHRRATRLRYLKARRALVLARHALYFTIYQ